MDKRLKWLLINLPGLFLAYIYIAHGSQALIMSNEYIEMAMVLGFSEGITKFLVFLVGVIDFLVAFAIVFYTKIWILFWAALWPIVPSVLEYMQTGEFEPEFITSSVAAVLVYFFKLRKYKKKGSRR